MNRLVIICILFSFLLSCEKTPEVSKNNYVARVVSFEPNCSTCILEFPEDSTRVREEIGQSRDDYYTAVNLPKGDFEIGQMIKVNIRKPEADDLNACITPYPSNDYQNIYILNSEQYNNLILNDTVTLSFHDCLYYSENPFYVCLDSIVADSRCPKGVYCFWAGNAEVRFELHSCNEKPLLFSLNTNSKFKTTDTIDGYSFQLVRLSPYPTAGHPINQNDYKAELVVARE